MGISQHPFGDRSQHDLLKQGCASSSDDDQVYVLDFGAMDELFRRMTNNNISRDLNPMCPPSLHYAFQSNLKVLAGIIQDGSVASLKCRQVCRRASVVRS
jgi:hypothetical protein